MSTRLLIVTGPKQHLDQVEDITKILLHTQWNAMHIMSVINVRRPITVVKHDAMHK